MYTIASPQKAHCFNVSTLFPNVFFIGMRGKLLALKLNLNAQKISVSDTVDIKEINEKIRRIECDNEGNLWLDTQYNGVYFLRFKNKKLDNYTVTLLGRKNGMKAAAGVKTFAVQQQVIMATDSGIITPVFPSNSNLPDSVIRFRYSKIFGDSITSSNGLIVKMTDKKYLVSGYGMHYAQIGAGKKSFDSCGFCRMNCSIEKISVFEDSIINICSPDGLFCYNSKNHRDFTKPFSTIVSQVQIGKDSVLFGGTFYTQTDSTQLLSIKQTPIVTGKQIGRAHV